MRPRAERWLLALLLTACRDAPPPVVEPAPTPPSEPEPMSAATVEATSAESDTITSADDVAKADNMGWVVLAPADRGFRVELPSEPTLVTKTITSPSGIAAPLMQWNASDEVLGTYFVVAVAPLVQQLVDHGDTSLALDRTLASVGQQPGMRLDASRTITLDDALGRAGDITISADGNEVHGEVRIYMVDYRMLQVMGVWSDEGGHTQVSKFLASLVLVPAPKEAPLDLWRTVAAPGELDVLMPGAGDRSQWRRGATDVDSVTLLSAFPPALYTLNSWLLSEAERRDPKLLDRWAARLDPKPTKTSPHKVLDGVGRLALGERHGWLGFVQGDRFYEMVWQTLTSGKPVHLEPPAELMRWLDSPRRRGAAVPQ